ncbi:type II secretion system F family protein [Blastopirellula marina]|uniref:Type II secretion system protein GspF domain-containing protein n=1 Tax=Blastopirellula marina TaxID=124 RepID=A0A2S8G199_9BACT|nr:type II secretion system F family protein [Blastopirellula marina]PQO38218.1 hypothetical protein C5Y98_09105 [Blastopirellula marina]PTL44874.1 hypothetical protein C5Y97_09110 [Blastopirellula marina]
MLFSPRISTSNLVQLCRRVGNQLRAGVDIRRVWQREAERASGAMKHVMESICEGIEEGHHMHEAINLTGDYFPKMFRQMIQLGDDTGHLDMIFLELADQYEHQLELRRAFLATILWPMIQLVMAILIVGFLIFVMGEISQMKGGEPIDPLGLGLVGRQGTIDYFLIIGTIVLGFWCVYLLWSRGRLGFLQLDRLVMSIPGIGPPIRTLCLARMAWALGLTVGGGMDIRSAMRLSLETTRSYYYQQFADQIDRELLRGDEVHEILRRTNVFPADFLDVVETGEISGTLSESMEKLSVLYFDKARSAMKTLAILGGVIVWMMIAGLIIAVIFKLFVSLYLAPINEALKGF